MSVFLCFLFFNFYYSFLSVCWYFVYDFILYNQYNQASQSRDFNRQYRLWKRYYPSDSAYHFSDRGDKLLLSTIATDSYLSMVGKRVNSILAGAVINI